MRAARGSVCAVGGGCGDGWNEAEKRRKGCQCKCLLRVKVPGGGGRRKERESAGLSENRMNTA